jgi:hypothetical protein
MTIFTSDPKSQEETWTQEELKTIGPDLEANLTAESPGLSDAMRPQEHYPEKTPRELENGSLDDPVEETTPEETTPEETTPEETTPAKSQSELDKDREEDMCAGFAIVVLLIIGLCYLFKPTARETLVISTKTDAGVDVKFRIQINQPGSNAASGDSIWIGASTTTKTETTTATVTEKVTPTITQFNVPPGVTETHWHVDQGCIYTMIDSRMWWGCSEEGENIEDVIKRVLDAEKQ